MADHLARHIHLNHRHALARQALHSHVESDVDLSAPSPIFVPEPSKIFGRQDSGDGSSGGSGGSDSGGDSTPTCTSQSQPGCRLPEGAAANNTGTIIGVSVAVPLVLAVIVLFFLHRHATRKQRAEDVKDAQDELDYGIDPKYRDVAFGKLNKNKKGRAGGKMAPEMAGKDGIEFEKDIRNGRHVTGMSIDLGNPYILPAEMNSSRDSLHSMTRSMTDRHDPYRAVQHGVSLPTFNDAGSIRSGSDKGLLANSQPNPMSRNASPLAPAGQQGGGSPPRAVQRKEVPAQSSTAPEVVNMPTFDFTDHSTTDAPERFSHGSHGSHKSVDVAAANRMSDPNKSLPATPQEGGLQHPPPRGESLNRSGHGATNNAGPVDPYEFKEIVVPPSPTSESRQNAEGAKSNPAGHELDASTFPHPPPPEPTNANRMTLGLGLDLAGQGNRLSVVRPLPPEDPNDTAESRANRIRSFYREYFADDGTHVHDTSGLDYYEDYGDEYLQDGAVFDPETGQFIVAQAPYADPITRRAMTPPPRGPPQKFRGGPRRPGHGSQSSTPAMGPRSRAYSNASYSRNGPGFGPRGKGPKRPLPPPAALHTLPTPSKLKEDAFGMAMDFAPAGSYREQAAGRPDSPLMVNKPYALTTPIAGSPLASSFTDLAAMPSPHMLRKSGTFTGLDFAPPPRIRDREGPSSDAASIRSGRSNLSAISPNQQQAIRAGAYRLSRVPKGLVGTRDDIMDSLKPQWKMGS